MGSHQQVQVCLNPFSIRENCRLLPLQLLHHVLQVSIPSVSGKTADLKILTYLHYACKSQSLQYQGKLQTYRRRNRNFQSRVSIPSVSGKTADSRSLSRFSQPNRLNSFSIRENCRQIFIHPELDDPMSQSLQYQGKLQTNAW